MDLTACHTPPCSSALLVDEAADRPANWGLLISVEALEYGGGTRSTWSSAASSDSVLYFLVPSRLGTSSYFPTQPTNKRAEPSGGAGAWRWTAAQQVGEEEGGAPSPADSSLETEVTFSDNRLWVQLSGAQEPQDGAPCPPLPADHVLSSGAVLFPGK